MASNMYRVGGKQAEWLYRRGIGFSLPALACQSRALIRAADYRFCHPFIYKYSGVSSPADPQNDHFCPARSRPQLDLAYRFLASMEFDSNDSHFLLPQSSRISATTLRRGKPLIGRCPSNLFSVEESTYLYRYDRADRLFARQRKFLYFR